MSRLATCKAIALLCIVFFWPMNPYSSTSEQNSRKVSISSHYIPLTGEEAGFRKLNKKETMNYSSFFSYKTQLLHLPVLAYFFSRRHFQVISFYPSSSLSPIPAASFPTLFHSHLIPVRGIGLCPKS